VADGCLETETDVKLSILTDNFPLEIGWTIVDWQSNTEVETGGPYHITGASVTKEMCIPKGCYVFTMTDSVGDGICCLHGQGSYSLEVDGVSLISNGGEFGSSASMLFGTCLSFGGSPTSSLVKQVYCRVLRRPPESKQAIVGWVGYLNSHTVKDLVRLGILSAEFKIRFVDGMSEEALAHTLYDVLLARAGDPGGLDTWEEHIRMHGWDNAVNSILASGEYNRNFGDDAVPGGGRAACG
jgi:hypothetical protein